jgi:replicative DNA helicase
MFIHSEDKYKEESEQTNITEILIEKHRNGPVGKIDLYFDKKSATFMSIEKTNVNQFASAFSDKGSFDQF